jgi:hypothetical protein
MGVHYQLQGKKLIEESRELPFANTDVVVAGGGAAGFVAAIAAARADAKVTLVESRSFLGGVATQAMMAALVAASYADGISRELIDEMAKLGGAPSYSLPRTVDTIPFDPESFKLAALEMVIKAGVHLLFYTQVCGPIVINGEVRGIVIESKKGRSAILAKQTIDCTGDADLASQAGVSCNFGRAGDHKTRPLTLLFRMGNVDVRKIIEYVEKNPEELQPQYRNSKPLVFNGNEEVVQRISGFYKLIDQAKKKGELYDEIHYFRLENLMITRGTVFCNTSRVYFLNGADPEDLTKAEIESRRQIQKIFAFAKKYIPGCEKAFVIDVSSSLGVRETRRIAGEYTVSDDDAYGDAKFDDGFMTIEANLVQRPCPVELDVHMPEPIEGSEKDWLERYPEKVPFEKHTYQISYRSLVPKDIKNLLVAGRTISVSHMLDSFTRNMIPCMRFGQAAGAAAALSAKKNITPKDLNFPELKAELIRQGLVL